jgi:O-antigen ligase
MPRVDTVDTSRQLSAASTADVSGIDLRFRRYLGTAAVMTSLGYALGYAGVGFGLLLLGSAWRLATRRKLPWVRTELDVPLGAFASVLILSALVSPYRQFALAVTFMLIVSGAVYFGSFASALQSDPALRPILLRTLAVGAVLAALVGMFYSATHYVPTTAGHFQHARAQIPRGVGPNGLGTTLLLGSILCLGGVFVGQGWRRAAWAVCSVVGFVGLVATGSRASLAGWVLAAAYLIYRELRSRPRVMAVAALLTFLAAGGVVAGMPQLANRLQTTATDVAGNRVRIWQTSLLMVRQHPLLGTGFGTFEQAYDQYRARGMTPEPFAFNLWLNLAVETGLLGVAAALWVAFSVWRAGPAPDRRGTAERAAPIGDFTRATIAAVWLGLLVDQFADNTLFSISTSAVLWYLLALACVPEWPSHGAGRTRQKVE